MKKIAQCHTYLHRYDKYSSNCHSCENRNPNGLIKWNKPQYLRPKLIQSYKFQAWFFAAFFL